MQNNELFQKYLYGGSYSLPYLLEFVCPGKTTLYFAGSTENIDFDANTYAASNFEYTPPDTQGKGGSLKISALGNSLIEFVENANENWSLKVVGLIAENGTVQKIKQYQHFYGSVSYNENMEINFELGSDDRMEMTFPPYKFDTDINRGNT